MDKRLTDYFEGSLDKGACSSLLAEVMDDGELTSQYVICKHISSLIDLSSRNIDETAGLKSYESFIKSRKRSRIMRLAVKVAGYAAVVAAAVIITQWFVSKRPSGEDLTAVVQTQSVSAPAGQRAMVSLPDGTEVILNANSTLSYPSVFGAERRVELVGEAVFDVSRDEAHPFIVSTGKMDVKVLGTRFDVSVYPGENLMVSLMEGTVSVYSPENEAEAYILSPGETLVETGSGYEMTAMNDESTAWVDGFFLFRNRTLGDIISQLENHYSVEISVENPSVLDYRFTGRFLQDEGVMEILRVFQKIYPISVTRDEETGQITLR